jgi:hypothetical protein
MWIVGRIAGAALMSIALGNVAVASGDPACRTPGVDGAPAEIDPAVTLAWTEALRATDAPLMERIAGIYYQEVPDSGAGTVDYLYRSYEPDGGYYYQGRTCTETGCTQNHGGGRWTASETGAGVIRVMISWSDLTRADACFTAEVRVDDKDLVETVSGQRWQRLR